MTKFGLSLDYAILAALDDWSPLATYVVKNSLNKPGSRFREGGIKTSHVLAACRRLERLGVIKQIPSTYEIMKVWQITEAGRRALSLYRVDVLREANKALRSNASSRERDSARVAIEAVIPELQN